MFVDRAARTGPGFVVASAAVNVERVAGEVVVAG